MIQGEKLELTQEWDLEHSLGKHQPAPVCARD